MQNHWLSPATALAALMLGASLWMRGVRRLPRQTASWTALAALWVCMVVLVGHVLGQPALTGRGMSLSACLGAAALALGVLWAERERGPLAILIRDSTGGRVLRRRLPFLIGLPLTLGWLRMLGERSGVVPSELGLPVTVVIAITLMLAINTHALLGIDRAEDERARSGEEARDTQVLLEKLVDNLPDMVYLKDAKTLAYIRINKAGEEMLGYPRRDLLGHIDHDFFPAEQSDYNARMERDALASGRLQLAEDEPVETRTGRRLLRTRRLAIPGPDGFAACVLVISEDVTELRFAEQEKRLLEGELKQALKDIHDLEAILPICATCKKVRDAKGHWHRVESYLEEHMEVRMSHGLCDECMHDVFKGPPTRAA